MSALVYDHTLQRRKIDEYRTKFFVTPENPDETLKSFHFGNFEDLQPPGRLNNTGRSTCPGDSGGPLMDFTLQSDGRATLIGTIVGGVDCEHSKELVPRSQVYKRSWRKAWTSVPNDNVWSITTQVATPVKDYVDWMNEVMLQAETNNNGRDKFLVPKAGLLNTGPDFDTLRSRTPKVTPAPPIERPQEFP